MSANNKILIISSVDYFGGTRTYLENLLSFYVNYKVDLTLVGNKATFSGKINTQLKKHHYHHNTLPEASRTISKILSISTLLKGIRDLYYINRLVKKHEPNLIIITPFEPTHYFSSLFLRVKKILIVHSYPNSQLNIFFRIISQFASPNYLMLTVSQAALGNIKQYWPHNITQNSSYLYNPPNHVGLNKRDQKNTILTMGHLEWYKDPITWLNTAELVINNTNKSICFEWRGDGGLKEHLLSEIKTRGLSKNVFIKPPINNLGSLFSRTLIYFQPSLVESQGISVCTAQSLGIPCVATNAGGLKEMIVNGKTGYITDCKNFSKMSNSIIRLINDQSIYKQFSNNAKSIFNNMSLENKWNDSMLNIHRSLKVQL